MSSRQVLAQLVEAEMIGSGHPNKLNWFS